METIKFTEENYNDFAQKAIDSMERLSTLQTLLTGKELSNDDVQHLKEFKVIKEYLDSPIGDEREVKLKKTFATAVTIAHAKGCLPFEVESPDQIASLVDEGLTRIKIYHKIATGGIELADAIDLMVDRLTARTIAFADKAIDKGTPWVVNALCTTLKSNPNTVTLVPVVKFVEPYIAPAAQKLIRKVVPFIAETAKPVLKKTFTTATKWVKDKITQIYMI